MCYCRQNQCLQQKSGERNVPPAAIPPSRHPLVQTHKNTCAFTRFSAHLTLFFILGHLTAAAAAYGGRPRLGPTNHTNTPAAALSGPVTLQVVIQSHATFYVAFLAAPIAHRAISEGIIFAKHVALQVHAVQTGEADQLAKCRKEWHLCNY